MTLLKPSTSSWVNAVPDWWNTKIHKLRKLRRILQKKRSAFMNRTDFTIQLQCYITAAGIEEELPSNLEDTLLAITTIHQDIRECQTNSRLPALPIIRHYASTLPKQLSVSETLLPDLPILARPPTPILLHLPSPKFVTPMLDLLPPLSSILSQKPQ
jgi:hypothetical protein